MSDTKLCVCSYQEVGKYCSSECNCGEHSKECIVIEYSKTYYCEECNLINGQEFCPICKSRGSRVFVEVEE